VYLKKGVWGLVVSGGYQLLEATRRSSQNLEQIVTGLSTFLLDPGGVGIPPSLDPEKSA